MTKKEIVREISKATGIESGAVKTAVEKFMDVVKESVVSKENVYLRGFGTFENIVKAERKARNITKGKTIVIPARGGVKFKPAAEFKSAVR